MLSFVKTRPGLILLSSIISAILFVGVFELVASMHYDRWKADFDSSGWFGKITIPSTNPVLMWEYRPYGEYKSIRTNRHGFRDLDYESTAKPDDTLRVAFAGDSVTLGMGVDLEDTFVRQFELQANQVDSDQRVQALNFAIDGYNTPQIYEMIRTKVLQFSPDRVVYVLCPNDFDFSQSDGKKILYFKKPGSFFLRIMEKVYQKLSGIDYHVYYFEKNKEAVFQNIVAMRDLLAARGVGFQVVILPVFPPGFDDYPLRDMEQEIEMFLQAKDIQVLALYEAFAATGESPGYYASDIWHPNVEGHRLIARQLLLL